MCGTDLKFFVCIQEQFVSAVTDFLKCLELQEKHLEPDDRLIAETYPVKLKCGKQCCYL